MWVVYKTAIEIELCKTNLHEQHKDWILQMTHKMCIGYCLNESIIKVGVYNRNRECHSVNRS